MLHLAEAALIFSIALCQCRSCSNMLEPIIGDGALLEAGCAVLRCVLHVCIEVEAMWVNYVSLAVDSAKRLNKAATVHQPWRSLWRWWPSPLLLIRTCSFSALDS